MKKNDLLKPREEELMDFLWEQDELLSTNEMMEKLETRGNWNRVTLYKTLQSLTEQGYVKVGAMERGNTQYWRKMGAAVSKEEYTLRVLKERGVNRGNIGNLLLLFLKTEKKGKGSWAKEEEERLKNDLEAALELVKD